MIENKILYDLDDVTIVPHAVTNVEHRGDVDNGYHINGRHYLPVFASPMECVINEENFDIFYKNGIIPIYPRTVMYNKRVQYMLQEKWVAFGLDEFSNLFGSKSTEYTEYIGKNIYVVIDNANGHMQKLMDEISCGKSYAKEYGYNLVIMAGNVANPEAYKTLAESGADYVKISIGSGKCCITASNSGNYYGLATLIDECNTLKQEHNLSCKIIADGGISNYDRAIKALALGSDYVMIGSMFGGFFESASNFADAELSERDLINGFTLRELNALRFDTSITEMRKKELIATYKPVKTVWGMSTKRAQMSIGLAQGKNREDIVLKTSEGVEKKIPVMYTVRQWVENFSDFLSSSMSYNDAFSLNDFIGKQKLMLLSDAARNQKNK